MFRLFPPIDSDARLYKPRPMIFLHTSGRTMDNPTNQRLILGNHQNPIPSFFSDVRSTLLFYGPPSLWLLINPSESQEFVVSAYSLELQGRRSIHVHLGMHGSRPSAFFFFDLSLHSLLLHYQHSWAIIYTIQYHCLESFDVCPPITAIARTRGF
jgi:hypothetical protein